MANDWDQINDDVNDVITDLDDTLANVKRKTEWVNGVPVIMVSRDGGDTWEQDESYDFSRAAQTIDEVDQTVGDFEQLDVSTEMGEIDTSLRRSRIRVELRTARTLRTKQLACLASTAARTCSTTPSRCSRTWLVEWEPSRV